MPTQKQIDAANERQLAAVLATGDEAAARDAGFNIAPVHGAAWAGSGRAAGAPTERAVAAVVVQEHERGDDVSDEMMAVARDLCGFFDIDMESEDELRRVLAALHADRGGFLRQGDPALTAGTDAEPKPPVVLVDGDNTAEVEADLWDAIYATTFNDFDVRLQDGRIAPAGLDDIAATATKLGFREVGDRIGKFRAALKGLPFVKRQDGSMWHPPALSAVKVVKPEDHEAQAAVTAEVESYFADEEDEVEETPKKPEKLTLSAGGRSVEVGAAAFASLVEEAGVNVNGEFDRPTLGRLISAAKENDKADLLNALVTVRDPVAPLYKVRTSAGKTWKSGKGLNQVAATEADRAAADIQNYFGVN